MYEEFKGIKIGEAVLPNNDGLLPEPESAANILAYQLKKDSRLDSDILFGNVTKNQMLYALESISGFIDHEKFMAG
jgi:hypothetical protein